MDFGFELNLELRLHAPKGVGFMQSSDHGFVLAQTTTKKGKQSKTKIKNSIVLHTQPSRRSPSSLPSPTAALPPPWSFLRPPPPLPPHLPSTLFYSCSQGNVFSTIFSHIEKWFFLPTWMTMFLSLYLLHIFYIFVIDIDLVLYFKFVFMCVFNKCFKL